MLCYKDKTFCASKVKKHTCGREYTAEDKKLNDTKVKLPIAWAYFCENPKAQERYSKGGQVNG